MTDWNGGLPSDIDYMFPARPTDPEMRESASVWIFEENGKFALPRVGIEAQGAVWDTHRYDMNVAFADGRVLRESAVGRSQSPIGPSGRPDTLGSDGLTFRCIEPFRRWAVSYEGEAWEGTVEEQIRAEFGAYADAGRSKGLDGRTRVPVSWAVELEMVAPAWVQDYREEKLAGMTERERADAGSMGYGWRTEHCFRGSGELSVAGESQAFNCLGSRIRRQSVRPMGAFRGHAWMEAVFPDGRAFGFITYPPMPGEDPEDTYNNAYVWTGEKFLSGKVRNAPFLRRVMPRGDDVSCQIETAEGSFAIAGETVNATFHMGNPGVNGFNNQQGGVKFTWDGQTTYGMIERSSPAEVCTVIL
ncbi:hypothetical protein [Novosphingobium sp.]|uniref:hypothetical protein n=1 Tax=Novosphingobium sp. TaxID=1874826 RepID=UPI00286E2CDB|nr:hypothetical protein [Novosphingobium sp.]